MKAAFCHHLGQRPATAVDPHVPEDWEVESLGADEAHRRLLVRGVLGPEAEAWHLFVLGGKAREADLPPR